MTNVNCIASMYCQNTTSVLYMKGTQSRVTPKPFKARRKSIFFLFSFQVLHREFSQGWRASLFCNLEATPLKASANHRLLEFFFPSNVLLSLSAREIFSVRIFKPSLRLTFSGAHSYIEGIEPFFTVPSLEMKTKFTINILEVNVFSSHAKFPLFSSFQVFRKGMKSSCRLSLRLLHLAAAQHLRPYFFLFSALFSKDSDAMLCLRASKPRLRATSCLPKQSSVKPRNYRYD